MGKKRQNVRLSTKFQELPEVLVRHCYCGTVELIDSKTLKKEMLALIALTTQDGVVREFAIPMNGAKFLSKELRDIFTENELLKE